MKMDRIINITLCPISLPRFTSRQTIAQYIQARNKTLLNELLLPLTVLKKAIESTPVYRVNQSCSTSFFLYEKIIDARYNPIDMKSIIFS